MNKKKFQMVRLLIIIILTIFISWAINSGVSVFVALFGIGIALVFQYLLRKQVTEILEDERSHRINEQAAMTTLNIFIPLVTLVAVTLIVIRNNMLPEYREIGTILSYSVCMLIIIYQAARLYHEKKH